MPDHSNDDEVKDELLTPSEIEALKSMMAPCTPEELEAERREHARFMETLPSTDDDLPLIRRHRILTEEERAALGRGILELWQINDLLSSILRPARSNPDGRLFLALRRESHRRAARFRRTRA